MSVYKFSILALLVCLFAPPLSFAATPLAEPDPKPESSIAKAMDTVAVKVKEILSELDRSDHYVVISDFVSRGKNKSSGGVEIGRQLSKSLEQMGLAVSGEGDKYTEISGHFRIVEGKADPADDFNSLGVNITVEFYDEHAAPLKINVLKINDTHASGGKDHANLAENKDQDHAQHEEPEYQEEPAVIGEVVYGDDVLAVSGVSYEVAPNLPVKEKAEQITQQYKKPHTKAAGTQVRGNEPFGVEILVNENGKLVPRTPVLKGKDAFVNLQKGDEYVVRIYNDADFKVTSGVSIDGVNVCTDAMDIAKNSRFLVNPHTSRTVNGWYFHQGKGQIYNDIHGNPLPTTKAFLISGYEDSVVGRVESNGSNISIGTVTVDFRAAWPKGSTPPPGEPNFASRSLTRKLTTTQGRDKNEKSKIVKDLEKSKHTRAVIQIRYSK